MEITKFLQKDIVTYLDNSSKFGTVDTKISSSDLESVLTSSIAPKKPDPAPASAPVQQSSGPNVSVNVNLTKEALREAVREMQSENKDLSKIDINPTFNSKKIDIPQPQTNSQSPKPQSPAASTPSATPSLPVASIPSVAPAEQTRIESPVQAESTSTNQELNVPNLPKSLSLPPKQVPLTKAQLPQSQKKTTDMKETASNQNQPIIKINSMLLELNNSMRDSDILKIVDNYTKLKHFYQQTKLDKISNNKVYSALKLTADLLIKRKESLGKINNVQEEISENIDLKPSPAPVVESEDASSFYMENYVQALKAIRKHDKLTALELLVTLSKKHPKNRAIKMRLKEALSL